MDIKHLFTNHHYDAISVRNQHYDAFYCQKLFDLHALILFYIRSEYKINNSNYYFTFHILQRCIRQQLFSASNVISQKLKVNLSLIL